MTGVRGVYRHVHLHALNLKETAIRHAASAGRAYEECRFVVCHIGGGISVSAHDRGRMVDGADIVGGEGPMAPPRCGALPVAEVLDYLDAGHATADVRRMCMKTGGFVDLLGTSDALEVSRRAEAGDEACRRAWDAMVYQICKEISSNSPGYAKTGAIQPQRSSIARTRPLLWTIPPPSRIPSTLPPKAAAMAPISLQI